MAFQGLYVVRSAPFMSRVAFLNRFFVALVLPSLILGSVSFAAAQDGKTDTADPAAAESSPASASTTPGSAERSSVEKSSPEADPLKRPLTEKQKKQNSKSLKIELSKTYKKWLDEDVRWIITDEEQKAFKLLSNDEERDQFIEAFWQRRDPTPDTIENEFKEEHYRRMAYANEHFAAGIPGWKSDRGRIYIMYGPADEIESHPSGGSYERPMEEGGGETSTFPFEDWRYRYLEGIGQEVIIEFVDTCMCGDYHMTMDRSEKDALLYTPNAGLTLYEQMGMSSKADRFTGGGLERLGTGPFSANNQTKQFDRLEQFYKLQKPPAVKFKDLEEVVSHKINVNMMPFDVRTDYVRVTSDTVQVDVPAELLPKVTENSSVYWKALPLRPNLYRIDVAVKDLNGDRSGLWSSRLQVPSYDDDRLSSSSLIVADVMAPVSTKEIGTGQFVIGNTKVRPRVGSASGKPVVFKRNQKVYFWMQVYNLGTDDKTHKPSATVEYNVINAATNKAVIHTVESTEQMGNIGDQVTLEKPLSASSLEPGIYRIQIKVNDNISKQTVDPSATFAVE